MADFSEFFFPRKCSVCKCEVSGDQICASCRDKILQLKKAECRKVYVDAKGYNVYYLYRYKGDDIKKYIFALKKRGNKRLYENQVEDFKDLSAIICKYFSHWTVTNIPRRRANVRKYGYDQSKEAAKRIAKFDKERMEYKELLKRRFFSFSKDQKDLDALARQRNAKGKFKAMKKENVENILLYDDVITTESSFRECVRQLTKVYGDINIVGLFMCSTDVYKY